MIQIINMEKVQTMNGTKMDISIPYYEDNSRINNGALGTFIKNGPQYLKDLLDGNGEKLQLPALEIGTMIHEYILQPEEFWKDYIILDFAVPKVKQQKDLCELYYTYKQVDPLASEDDIILKAYNTAYSNKKSNDVKLKEAKEILDLYSNYIEYYANKDSKKVISFADLNTLKNIKANLEEHKKANELLWNLPKTFECHNEFHINWEVPKFNNLKCKSLLDRVCFDHVNKKIILIDLKTTPNVYNFKHSIEEFDYFRQIAFYGLAIQWYMQEVLNLNTEDYDFEAYIIAIGKDKYNQIRVFNMNNQQILSEKVDLITETLNKISYHITSDNWKHSKEYYDSTGIEEIS